MVPPTVTTGPRALRSTCRRTTVRSATPRARATSTCSRPSSSSIAERVTRARSPAKVIARANAGRVRWYSCWERPTGVPPGPGNQPSCTEKSETSAMAVTKDGVAVATPVPMSTVRSTGPGRSAARIPDPTPMRATSRAA